MILALGVFPSKSSVMSSFDKGCSAGAVARLSKPANIRRAIPSTNFLERIDFDFITESLSALELPTSECVYMDRVILPGKSCMGGAHDVGPSAVRPYAEALAGAMEVRAGVGAFTGSVG